MNEKVGAIIKKNIVTIIFAVLCVFSIAFSGQSASFVLGAAAGQIGLILITHWGIGGAGGILICMLIATLLSLVFGLFAGGIFNRTVGQEMITGMIIGYFAKGVFDLVFLKLFGKIIPMDRSGVIRK